MSASVLASLIEDFVSRPPSSVTRPRVEDPLSVRETDVLSLIGGGFSNSEIAADPFISVATVKCHVRHILAKLGRWDRVQAVCLPRARSGRPRRPWVWSTGFVGWGVAVSRKAPCHPHPRRPDRTPL